MTKIIEAFAPVPPELKATPSCPAFVVFASTMKTVRIMKPAIDLTVCANQCANKIHVELTLNARVVVINPFANVYPAHLATHTLNVSLVMYQNRSV
jgi:hypothetical protein